MSICIYKQNIYSMSTWWLMGDNVFTGLCNLLLCTDRIHCSVFTISASLYSNMEMYIWLILLSWNKGQNTLPPAPWSTQSSFPCLSENQKSSKSRTPASNLYVGVEHWYKILRELTFTRFEKKVVIARQFHFNYTTPDRSRQEMLNTMTPLPTEHWPFMG